MNNTFFFLCYLLRWDDFLDLLVKIESSSLNLFFISLFIPSTAIGQHSRDGGIDNRMSCAKGHMQLLKKYI